MAGVLPKIDEDEYGSGSDDEEDEETDIKSDN